MPYLSQSDRDAYANERKCPECKQTISNAYCSRCDEFYDVGHKSNCSWLKDQDKHDSTTCGGDRGYR